MFICLHIYLKELARLVSPIVRAYRTGERAHLSGRCNTDLLIGMSEYETRSALIITKWFNVGAGSSPDDPKWKLHADLTERLHTGKVRPSLHDRKTSAESVSKLRHLELRRPCDPVTYSISETSDTNRFMYKIWGEL